MLSKVDGVADGRDVDNREFKKITNKRYRACLQGGVVTLASGQLTLAGGKTIARFHR